MQDISGMVIATSEVNNAIYGSAVLPYFTIFIIIVRPTDMFLSYYNPGKFISGNPTQIVTPHLRLTNEIFQDYRKHYRYLAVGMDEILDFFETRDDYTKHVSEVLIDLKITTNFTHLIDILQKKSFLFLL